MRSQRLRLKGTLKIEDAFVPGSLIVDPRPPPAPELASPQRCRRAPGSALRRREPTDASQQPAAAAAAAERRCVVSGAAALH